MTGNIVTYSCQKKGPGLVYSRENIIFVINIANTRTLKSTM